MILVRVATLTSTGWLLIGLLTGCADTGDVNTEKEAGSPDPAAVPASKGQPGEGHDESSGGGGVTAVLDLCAISDLNDRASRLFPEHHVRCHPMPGQNTTSAQLSGANWVWGKVNWELGTSESEELIEAIIEGVEPEVGTAVPTDEPHLESACPSASDYLRCEDGRQTIDGRKCLTRQSGLPDDEKTNAYQLDCYLGRAADSGLDVGLYIFAAGPLSPADVEDFTAAVVRAARNE